MPYRDPNENARVKISHRLRNNRLWEAYKERTPCFDCGKFFKHWQMEFDHVRGEKRFNIGALKHGSMFAPRAAEELEKCDLVCALCHRDRTYYRQTLMTSRKD